MTSEQIVQLTTALSIANRISTAAAGKVLLTNTSDYGTGAGIAPVGDYAGFIVGGSGATITAMTPSGKATYNFSAGQNISNFPIVAGQVYFFYFTTITITAGALMLIKA